MAGALAPDRFRQHVSDGGQDYWQDSHYRCGLPSFPWLSGNPP